MWPNAHLYVYLHTYTVIEGLCKHSGMHSSEYRDVSELGLLDGC